MIETSGLLLAAGVVAAVSLAGWLLSIARADVSIVDSLWSLVILIAYGTYLTHVGELGPRSLLTAGLAAVWALRLSAHITVRNWGEGEDRRYRQIRADNEPHFALKSLYIVFGLQGTLALVVSLPLMAAASGPTALGWLDIAGIGLWTAGMVFEVVGDVQLQRFRADPANAGRVMSRGLWRYTRHPNYFGEFLVWWGLFLVALAAGGWWTVISPILMSTLLLRVSGVSLLEQDIAERRPGYREYIASTNAFFPGPPRTASTPISR